MTVRSQHLKLAGAVSAAALAVSAFAAPALAAPHNIRYNCNKGNPVALGPIDTTVTAATPAKLVAGQKSKTKVTVVVHLNNQQTILAQSLGSSVSGKISSKGVDALNLKIPATDIPPPPATTFDVTAKGTGTVSSSKVGNIKVTTGTITAVLHLSVDASSSCKMPSDGTQVLGTTTVTKDKTKSKVSAKVKGSTATVKDKVKSHFGLKATGKVKFTLKKGHKTVGHAKGKISKKGVAKVSFQHLKSSKYTVTAKYKGSSNLKGSSGKTSFKG
jgi:hypothetical protein